MKTIDLAQEIGRLEYPGRGIVLGLSADGKNAAIAYFIMGRSVNSRNRIFVTENDGIRTEAFDPALLEDPSLIIYAPVRTLGNYTVVTNGDQTDTIIDGLDAQMTWAEALSTREFEPDKPNYTPRISGLVHVTGARLDYQLSILKSGDMDPATCQRFYFSYTCPKAGEGHYIHTYAGGLDENGALLSFEGEPVPVTIGNDPDAFAETIWNSLNEDNKVSLFTRFIDLETGRAVSKIYNKNIK